MMRGRVMTKGWKRGYVMASACVARGRDKRVYVGGRIKRVCVARGYVMRGYVTCRK